MRIQADKIVASIATVQGCGSYSSSRDSKAAVLDCADVEIQRRRSLAFCCERYVEIRLHRNRFPILLELCDTRPPIFGYEATGFLFARRSSHSSRTRW